MLSDAQFQALHSDLRKQGGFTVDVKTGQSPTSGWMVADPGREERSPSSATTPDTLKSYTARNSHALGQPSAHFGSWAEDGTDFMDVSRNYPTDTALGRAVAIGTTWRHEQKSAYNMSPTGKKKDSFDTEYPPNPAGDPDKMRSLGLRTSHFMSGHGVGAVLPRTFKPKESMKALPKGGDAAGRPRKGLRPKGDTGDPRV